LLIEAKGIKSKSEEEYSLAGEQKLGGEESSDRLRA